MKLKPIGTKLATDVEFKHDGSNETTKTETIYKEKE